MTAGLAQPPGERAADAMEADARYMAAALNLARRGLGRVAPNPAVGALVVKDRQLVGRGFTGDGGRPHAETIALEQAGEAARGATLYVTLEPCSHHGRTPPCADAIVAAGIARVVSAIDDPDPRVSGQGHARLSAAGLELRTGVLAEAAQRLNLGHCLRVTEKRPMIALKLAETADGYAAGPAGSPRLKITDTPADHYVHMQRTLYDAILIGSGTAIADDPLLTVRLPGLDDCRPLRIVLDGALALPTDRRLVATAADYPTLVVAGRSAPHPAAARLKDRGVEILRIADDGKGRIDPAAALAALAERGLTRIFCEGGPNLAADLMGRGVVDEMLLLTGPLALGAPGLAALQSSHRALLDDARSYERVDDRMIGSDRLRRYERRL